MKKESLNERNFRIKKEFDRFKKIIRKYKYISLFGVGRLAENW